MTETTESLTKAETAAIARALPNLSVAKITRLSAGASCETWRIDTKRVDTTGGTCFALRRRPKHKERLEGVPGLRMEAELMRRALAGGVPVPDIIHVFDEGEGLGEALLMSWCDGETLGHRIVASEALADARKTLAFTCGRILALIHAIPVDASLQKGGLVSERAPDAIARIQAAYAAYDTPVPALDFILRWLAENAPDTQPRALVHGDFRNGNLVIAPDGIKAVLDWELAHIGDPLEDLGWLCVNSWRFGTRAMPVGGFGLVHDLCAGYESVSGTPVEAGAIDFWQAYGSARWAVMCLGMAASFRSGDDATVDRVVIGRRMSEGVMDALNLITEPVADAGAPAEAAFVGLPTLPELMAASAGFLREDVAAHTEGRRRFMSYVAANALDIAAREMRFGGAFQEAERGRISALLGREGGLEALRHALSEALREGHIALDAPGLQAHLRLTAMDALRIDQPQYSGLTPQS